MAGIECTIAGNVVRTPELKYTPSGAAVASFTVACNERVRDSDGQWKDANVSFMRCSAWRDLAENLTESVSKGDRVIVTGLLRQHEYTGKDDVKKTVWELSVQEAGPSLRYATKISKTQQNADRAARATTAAADDPWADDAIPADEPPF